MAENTDFVISFIGDLRDIRSKLKQLERVNKVIAQKFGKDFTKATAIISQSLDKISTKPIILKGGRKATEELRKFTTVIRTTDGSLKTLTETQRRVNGALKSTNTTIRNGANVTRTFGANLKTLLSRAALTIPVWFALRRSIGAVFRTIKNGLKDLVDFDRALQKLRRNVSATSDNLEKDFRNITEEIQRFSVESGVSVEDITKAIQRFATVGFDIETSLKGGLDAVKLSVNLFGDAEQTANAFARSLRVLTADIEDSEEKQRAISEALALTDQLWQTNAFEVNEFSNNLEKFAGTAKIANLSIEDTLTLLATLSTAGISGRSGRLLRSTLLRALADFENINRELRLGLDPDETPTIEFVLSLVQALKRLRARDNIPVELTETLGDLFTIRGTEVLAGLTALETILKENIALTPDVDKFNQTFEDLSQTTNRLVARFTNLNKEIGRAFVTGLVGGDDFDNTMQKLISTQTKLLAQINNIGVTLREVFTFDIRTPFIIRVLEKGLKGIRQQSIELADEIEEGLAGILSDIDLGNLIIKVSQSNLPVEQAKLIVEELSKQLVIEKEIADVKEDQIETDKKSGVGRTKKQGNCRNNIKK